VYQGHPISQEVDVKRTLLLFACAATLLVAPASAHAKNISSLQLCGPAACATIDDPATIQRWSESNGYDPVGTPPLAAYYRFVTTISAGPGETFDNGKTTATWSEWWVPSAGALRGTGESNEVVWSRQSGRSNAIFATAVRHIDPFPAPVITAATIGGKNATDPASYARLFDSKWRLASDWNASDWRRVRLFSAVASPWTDGRGVLRYSPRKHTLLRDGGMVYKVPRSVAGRLARARSLAQTSGHRQLAFAAAGGVVAVGLAFAMRRRRK
jgi:hypothetical protein